MPTSGSLSKQSVPHVSCAPLDRPVACPCLSNADSEGSVTLRLHSWVCRPHKHCTGNTVSFAIEFPLLTYFHSLTSLRSCRCVPYSNSCDARTYEMDDLPPNVKVSSHPCLRAKLSQLRSNKTQARETKTLVHEIALILGIEALAKLDVITTEIVS